MIEGDAEPCRGDQEELVGFLGKLFGRDRDDEGGAVVGVGGQDGQRHAQLDGRARAHPGELTTTDDADDGEASRSTAR